MATSKQTVYCVFRYVQMVFCVGELCLLLITICYLLLFWSDVERELSREKEPLNDLVSMGQIGTLLVVIMVCLWPIAGIVATVYELFWCQIVHFVLMMTTFLIPHIVVSLCLMIFMALDWHKSGQRRRRR